MAYNPKYNEHHYAYRTKKFRRVGVDFERNYFNLILKPAAEAAGLPVNTFIKRSIAEKIEQMKHDGLFEVADIDTNDSEK